VDSWLLWKLTGGRVHATDVSNAARTMLFDIRHNAWDHELLKLLHVPDSLLPQVHPAAMSSARPRPRCWARPSPSPASPATSKRAVRPGLLQGRAGQEHLRHRLLHADAHRRASSRPVQQRPDHHRRGAARPRTPEYALEGSVFIGGAVVQWLRDGLRAIRASGEVQALAESVPDAGGVMFVPAFTGLGAPYWNADARGAITGLTRGSTVAHIARAALESIAFQSAALLQAMAATRGRRRRAGDRAAGGRRRLRQRPADAVPGRPAGHSGGAPQGDRDHRAGRGLPGRPGLRRHEQLLIQ
jgi:glycerol kinase